MITFPNAKINLGLHVTERRTDGYHNIETFFYPVGLCDALEILPSGSLEFYITGISLPGNMESNLVVKAYRLLQRDFDIPPVKIHLHKVIPPGAGLGGGSSDAAFALKMFNEIFVLNLSIPELEKYASLLGADCPFFIRNVSALATGKGELLNPFTIDLSDFDMVIIKPPFMVNTSLAYASVTPGIPDLPLAEIMLHPPEEWPGLLKNDFEKSVFKSFPEISDIKETLFSQGAVYASLSGSGSAVFGLFRKIPDLLSATFPENYFIYTDTRR